MPAKLSRPTLLSLDDFHTVVRLAPLVFIDFIIRNARGEVLLGLRNNEPAQGFYFVPGGIVLKQERLHEAFARILNERPITTRRLRMRGSSAFTSISMMPTLLAMRILARTMSCWRMSLSLLMHPRPSSTPSTAKCAGGASAICWSRIGCTKTQRRIFADRK